MARRTIDERIAELQAKQARELAIARAKETLGMIRANLNEDSFGAAMHNGELLLESLAALNKMREAANADVQRQFAAATGLPVTEPANVAPLKSVKS